MRERNSRRNRCRNSAQITVCRKRSCWFEETDSSSGNLSPVTHHWRRGSCWIPKRGDQQRKIPDAWAFFADDREGDLGKKILQRDGSNGSILGIAINNVVLRTGWRSRA